MINRLHARFHRPEKGWDPIPGAYANTYAQTEWQNLDLALVERIGAWVGGFAGLRVLDLGSGPGQYAIAFAQRGAEVTCHDVSATYLAYARAKAEEAGVASRVRYSLGYLDEAPARLGTTYDLVFNRVCWYYGFGDRSFARVFYGLVRPGGYGYIDTPHTAFNYDQHGAGARLRMWLNARCGIKIGHPFPPHGRLASLFLALPLQSLHVDYENPLHDCLWLRKSRDA